MKRAKRSSSRKVYLLLTVFISQLILIQSRNMPSFNIFHSIEFPSMSSFISSNQVDEDVNAVPEDEEGPTVNYEEAEKQLTQFRIEYIKNQILKKLRLKETPVVGLTDLPKPLKEYENLLPEGMDAAPHLYDDYYGKTTQAIIFPYEDEARCLRINRFPSACLPFQVPTDIHGSDVSRAELWIYKEPDTLDEHNQTFVVSEVAHWDTNKSFQKTKPIAIQETHLQEGWLKIDVTYVAKNWLDFQDSPTHAINVVCKTCGMDKTQSPISFASELKPFLIIYTHSQERRKQQHRRMKRSTICGQGINECCRENLYISFADIGWDNWIIKPDGYNAHFCKGSCMNGAAMASTSTAHRQIMTKFMLNGRTNHAFRPELTPCCTATQFQSLQLVYMDNNKTLTTKVLPNMIVDACGCM